MVDVIHRQFEDDLKHYAMVVQSLDVAAALCRFGPQEPKCLVGEALEFFEAANALNDTIRESLPGLPVVRGAMFVQAISRFESFARQEVEDLSLRASNNAEKYAHLPKAMRENLQLMAAMVLGNPRKYRMDGQVETIVKTLATNLDGSSKKGEINSRCLSITTENIRSSVLDELFRRLGIEDLWARIGANPELQIYLEQPDAAQASGGCQKRLNVAVERRNSIVHNPESVTWPSTTEVTDLLDLLKHLGSALSRQIPVFELRLKSVSEDIKKKLDEKVTPAA